MGDLTEKEIAQFFGDVHSIAESLKDIAIAITIIKEN